MTSDVSVLRDALSKRIARGSITVKDLALLSQLLRCQRRNCLMLGVAVGAALAMVFLGLARVVI